MTRIAFKKNVCFIGEKGDSNLPYNLKEIQHSVASCSSIPHKYLNRFKSRSKENVYQILPVSVVYRARTA
jgi:hypothetical protein